MIYMMQMMTKMLVLTSLRGNEDGIIFQEKEDRNAKRTVVLLLGSVESQSTVLEAYQMDRKVKVCPCQVLQNGLHLSYWSSLDT